MNLEIDRNKLKVKHFLNIQAETIGYPSKEDYLYELVNLIDEQEKKFDSWFVVSWLQRKICTNISLEEHLQMLDELESDGYIYKFNEGDGRSKYPTYKFKNHPWIKDN